MMTIGARFLKLVSLYSHALLVWLSAHVALMTGARLVELCIIGLQGLLLLAVLRLNKSFGAYTEAVTRERRAEELLHRSNLYMMAQLSGRHDLDALHEDFERIMEAKKRA
jgi:hypothetical protein